MPSYNKKYGYGPLNVTTQLELEEEIVQKKKKACICSDAPLGLFSLVSEVAGWKGFSTRFL